MTEETLFHEALAKSPAERTTFLDVACAGQPELRAAVEALLQAHEASGGFLDQPVVPPSEVTGAYTPDPGNDAATIPPRSGTSTQTSSVEPGTVIADRYVLVERIGEGGMGEVWVAKQTEPVKRKVALKLIKAGMDSKEILSRFEQERQALAMMDHPNIARVLDGGMTGGSRSRETSDPFRTLTSSATGQPFFVMELVNGLSLTKFCDDAKLTPRERLELFVPICQAVQHAHQKGIVHRDLKPANILVTLIDGRPTPKVIDFGVAKATAGKVTDQSMNTQFGAVVGTLEYMSPEQAGHSSDDVDTRADIYSLGVILYELLTGLRPFDSKRLKSAALFEMIRVILEEVPSRPSTRLSTDEALPSLAAVRQTEPRRLSSMMRGELDWIVMKCLEKERTRRYETVNGLARDIQRYLADEPVEARPPSATYRFQKFVARNKGQVVAASLLIVALLAGLAGTAWQAIRAENARAAEADRAEGERVAKEEAQTREAETKAVLDFVENKVFAAARPKDQEGGQGYEVKLADAITAALPYVEKSFADQPLIEARLRMTLGTSFSYLGKTDVAEQQYRRARDLFTAKLGPDEPDTLRSMGSLANSYSDLGRLPEALALCEETLKLMKDKLGPDHPATLTSMNNLANSYEALGRHPESLTLREETLKLQKAKLGPDHPDTLRSMGNLAQSYAALGRQPEALALREETFKLYKAKLGPGHAVTLGSMHNLAVSYGDLGRHPEALALLEETLKLTKAKLGPDHPHTLKCMANLAGGFAALGRHREGLKVNEETLKLRKAKLGHDHPDTLQSMNNLAVCYATLGLLPEALTLREETLKLQKAKLGPDHPHTLESMNNLAESFAALGRHTEALTLREETLKPQKAKLGPDHPKTLGNMVDLAANYAALGRLADATKLYEETLVIMKAKIPDHQFTLNCMNNLANCYAALGRHSEALALDEETLKLRKAKLGPSHVLTIGSMLNLAVRYRDLGRHPEALALEEETLKLMKVELGPDHPYTLGCMYNLAISFAAVGRHAEALTLNEETLKLRKAKLGPDHPDTLASMGFLANSYAAVGRHAEALTLNEETLKLQKAKLGANHRQTVETIYGIACMHALMIAKAEDRGKQADLAMDWLQQAVAAGFKNAAHMKKDTDLDPLRERDDFKKLLAELEAKEEKK